SAVLRDRDPDPPSERACSRSSAVSFALTVRRHVRGGGALADPQARRPRARVARDLGIAGDDRLAGDQLAYRIDALAGLLGEPARQRAGPCEVAKAMLDQAVLERVEADDRAPPPGDQQVGEPGEELLELLDLAVDRDAQRLERAGRRVDLRL